MAGINAKVGKKGHRPTLSETGLLPQINTSSKIQPILEIIENGQGTQLVTPVGESYETSFMKQKEMSKHSRSDAWSEGGSSLKKVQAQEEKKDAPSKKKKERPQWKIKMDKFLNIWQITIFMTTITVYALFADDLRLLFF